MLHFFNSYGDFPNPDPLPYKALKKAHKFQEDPSDL